VVKAASKPSLDISTGIVLASECSPSTAISGSISMSSRGQRRVYDTPCVAAARIRLPNTIVIKLMSTSSC
jgi:hypothetical protein